MDSSVTRHRFAQLTAVMTFLLLIAGALVTSTDSGLSVPDWPLSYGTLFPPMVGGIAYEHTHRMMAAGVGFMMAILAGWLWLREPRRWVRWLGYGGLVAVIVQALLGGLTVLWVLPAPISVAHACLGQTVLCVVVGVALVTSPRWPTLIASPGDAALRGLYATTTGLLGVQLLLGAVVRHTSQALMWHVVGAIAVTVMVAQVVWRVCGAPPRQDGVVAEYNVPRGATSRPRARCSSASPRPKAVARWRGRGASPPWLVRVAILMALAVVAQLILGVLAWMSAGHVVVATAHVAVGSFLLATSWLATLIIFAAAPITPVQAMTAIRQRLADYAALAKPRLTALALFATGVGFLVGAGGWFDPWTLWHTLFGSALVGAGGNALNQWMERDADARMTRTKSRPLPAGRLSPAEALGFGLVSSALGVMILEVLVNRVASLLALLTLITYVGIYTSLKRVTSLCTLVGAVAGAIPPVIGWAGARGTVTLEAWVIFGIVFLWQLPHFLAIAWVHQADYAKAGFRMLSVVDPHGSSTARQIVLYGLALLPTSLLPTIVGVTGPLYFVGAMVAGVWFIGMAVVAAKERSCAVAKRLFLASVGYLPSVLGLLVIDSVLL